MRKITLLVVHCSATAEGKDYTVQDIDRWHRERGWGCQGYHIGYHYVIYRDGSVHAGRPESLVGAHVRNHNAHSIGICYIGGLRTDGQPKDTRTEEQKSALLRLLTELKTRYPQALIVGHRDLDPQKTCPCFDAAREYCGL